ncbi:GIN domain-containing protein [Pseudoduganella sp. UC29_106]|uniref:GIN domain-containing protein n=1 Tax=Pseudoduganella sp. UC29_106 TaxID=3374553 RepID=UPI003756B1BB
MAAGPLLKQTRDVSPFEGLELGMPGSVEVRIGGSDNVTIEVDDNLQPLIETVIEGGTLKIRPVRKELQLNTRGMKIFISARKIDKHIRRRFRRCWMPRACAASACPSTSAVPAPSMCAGWKQNR